MEGLKGHSQATDQKRRNAKKNFRLVNDNGTLENRELTFLEKFAPKKPVHSSAMETV